MSIAPLTKSSSTLLSFGYWRLPGAGFLPVQYYYLAFCHGLGFGVYNFSAELSSSASKGTIKGWAFLYLSAGVLWLYLVIFCLLFISGFAGLLPVVSWVLIDKSLIINGIHFSGMQAFSGCFLLLGVKHFESVGHRAALICYKKCANMGVAVNKISTI